MNLVTTSKPKNLVRADSEEAREGFRTLEEDESYDYFVPMDDNRIHLQVRRKVTPPQKLVYVEPDYTLVFNLRYNIAGLVKADEMVEPVNLTVNVGEKE